jgi:DNA processing protein
MSSAAELKYWVGFSKIPGIGRVKLARLQEYFSGLEHAWKAPARELERAGLDSKSAEVIAVLRPKIDLEREMEKLEQYKVRVLTCESPEYPWRLKEIYDYPPVLYVRGDLLAEDENCLAVVGTRRATVYGRQVTEEIVGDLARNGITIVSGLARGIDSIAHRAALEAGGRTLAVFGCGLDIVYPAENLRLAREIMEHGALVSEYPLGTKPKADNFPRRNRIMSGMSLGVLVIEAGESSGAMITAEQALEQNREVFAVPGSILSPASRGTNRLIKECHAKLVQNYMDILEELNLTIIPRQMEMEELLPADETESRLLEQISHEPTHIDDICRTSGLGAAVVSSTLAMMELKGMVKQVGGMSYVLAKGVRGKNDETGYRRVTS